MTSSPDLDKNSLPVKVEAITPLSKDDYLDELPDEVEMPLFDHLEELRWRIFYSLLAVGLGALGSFVFVKPIVYWLELPATGAKFLQLAPGEFFWVSIEVAGYSGLLIASPIVLYHIIRFVLPGLTRRERKLLGPVILGSSVLFAIGIAFGYYILLPAALNFFITYGGEVVEQMWSIGRYFDFVLMILFLTGLAFQVPIIQIILSSLGIVNSKLMLTGWRYIIVGGFAGAAILTPSADPFTQILLATPLIGLYFGGIAIVKLLGN